MRVAGAFQKFSKQGKFPLSWGPCAAVMTQWRLRGCAGFSPSLAIFTVYAKTYRCIRGDDCSGTYTACTVTLIP